MSAVLDSVLIENEVRRRRLGIGDALKDGWIYVGLSPVTKTALAIAPQVQSRAVQSSPV